MNEVVLQRHWEEKGKIMSMINAIMEVGTKADTTHTSLLIGQIQAFVNLVI